MNRCGATHRAGFVPHENTKQDPSRLHTKNRLAFYRGPACSFLPLAEACLRLVTSSAVDQAVGGRCRGTAPAGGRVRQQLPQVVRVLEREGGCFHSKFSHTVPSPSRCLTHCEAPHRTYATPPRPILPITTPAHIHTTIHSLSGYTVRARSGAVASQPQESKKRFAQPARKRMSQHTPSSWPSTGCFT